ncbi:D-alanyl-D-alanine carboxypeptidase family protein [Lachnospiraceae bacterium JLR.KK008]
MKRNKYRILALAVCFSVMLSSLTFRCPDTYAAGAAEDTEETESASVDIAAPSAILMEASTGQAIFERDAQERRSPASITKIMTLLLIFDSLEAGRIRLEDEVITSAHAKSMGGSQVFLEEGEVQTVDTLIKCITVASGNDASVAMAEHIAGSEEEFVAMMNKKAEELGMVDTHFEDCCGLTNSDNHYTTARDVALMSRALITEHPEIYQYTKIWMEDITHTTKQGSSQFTLSSTNKLLKQYPYTTGLKTGSTDKAKYCLSATANKDGIDLIAVVMAAPDYKIRFQDAIKLLNYGFAVSSVYTDENKEQLSAVKVSGGVTETAGTAYKEAFRYLDVKGSDMSQIQKEIRLPEEVQAPVRAGDIAGKAVYTLGGKEIGTVDILFTDTVEKATYRDYVKKVFQLFF